MKHKIKKTVLLTSLLILATVAVGGTLAYLFDTAGPVENTFTPTSVPIKVEEKLENNVKSDVQIKNTSTEEDGTSAYIRAAVVKNWLDADKNVVYLENTPEGYKEEPKTGAYFQLDDSNREFGNWYYHTDGYYYYMKPVAPEGLTDALIEKWGITYPEGSEYILQVEILAQSVQSVPVTKTSDDTWTVDAAFDLWGVTLTVDKDGIIKTIK